MFDIFRPPRVRMKKLIPAHATASLARVESFAEEELKLMSNEVQREHAIAFVISVWACNCAMNGAFQLSQYDYELIRNTGNACFNFLAEGINREGTVMVVEKLAEAGLIPMTPENNSN